MATKSSKLLKKNKQQKATRGGSMDYTWRDQFGGSYQGDRIDEPAKGALSSAEMDKMYANMFESVHRSTRDPKGFRINPDGYGAEDANVEDRFYDSTFDDYKQEMTKLWDKYRSDNPGTGTEDFNNFVITRTANWYGFNNYRNETGQKTSVNRELLGKILQGYSALNNGEEFDFYYDKVRLGRDPLADDDPTNDRPPEDIPNPQDDFEDADEAADKVNKTPGKGRDPRFNTSTGRLRRGRASTILTSPRGLEDESSSIARKYLLGA